jgi:hypothetical protein
MSEVDLSFVENSPELVRGEATDELTQAWNESKDSTEVLIYNLDPSPQQSPTQGPKITHQDLLTGGLSGNMGKIKRSMLGRLKDRFFMFWNSHPRTHGREKNTSCRRRV